MPYQNDRMEGCRRRNKNAMHKMRYSYRIQTYEPKTRTDRRVHAEEGNARSKQLNSHGKQATWSI